MANFEWWKRKWPWLISRSIYTCRTVCQEKSESNAEQCVILDSSWAPCKVNFGLPPKRSSLIMVQKQIFCSHHVISHALRVSHIWSTFILLREKCVASGLSLVERYRFSNVSANISVAMFRANVYWSFLGSRVDGGTEELASVRLSNDVVEERDDEMRYWGPHVKEK
jgi:hypothetical protein